jgi:hypothetical protein
MLEAGYSKSYAKNPGKLKSTDIWKELTEKYLPDDDLLTTHREGLQATKRVTSPTEPDAVDPDYAVRHKYLETGYKIKGKLKEDIGNVLDVINLEININGDRLNTVAGESVSASSPLQSLEVRTESGENVLSNHHDS